MERMFHTLLGKIHKISHFYFAFQQIHIPVDQLIGREVNLVLGIPTLLNYVMRACMDFFSRQRK